MTKRMHCRLCQKRLGKALAVIVLVNLFYFALNFFALEESSTPTTQTIASGQPPSPSPRAASPSSSSTSPSQSTHVTSRRVIGYACVDSCGGWADRQKGIVTAYVIAAMLGARFKIHMPVPCELSFFLSPRDLDLLDWRLRPRELEGKRVQWIKGLDGDSLDFVEEFLVKSNPEDMFYGEYVFITTNMNVISDLKKHRLAQGIHWLQERSVPEIYRKVLTDLFTLMPGPRAILDNFMTSIPAGAKLVCAQIRVGGDGDSESFNNTRLPPLVKFLAPYNRTDPRSSPSSSPSTRFLFTSDKAIMVRSLQAFFPPPRVVQMAGPVTHVDKAKGSDMCGGFARALVEQYLLAACDVLVISESGLAKMAAFMRNTDQDLYLFHDGLVEKFDREGVFPNRRAW